ncbi:MAG: phage/plasmid primase, P4 family [Butyribacter sp.]|nr:phage/plasmid primase, P4 family [bacterium]MDY3854497.1 phage/plasmid primase, P4 family [Butyribacter sp.]
MKNEQPTAIEKKIYTNPELTVPTVPVDLLNFSESPTSPVNLVEFRQQSKQPINLVEFLDCSYDVNETFETNPAQLTHFPNILTSDTELGNPTAMNKLKDLPKSYHLAEAIAGHCVCHRFGKDIYLFDMDSGTYMILGDAKNDLIRANIPSEYFKLCTPSAEADAVRWLSSRLLRDKGPLPHYPQFVPFRDCVFDLATNTWIPEKKPEFYLTFTNAVSVLNPVSMECPVFERYLATITLGDEVLADLLCTMMAYAISNCRCIKAFFMLIGPRDCGKSICLKMLEEIIGTNLCTHIPLNQLTGRFSLSTLRGSRLNDVAETDNLDAKSLTTLKWLTGGDDISSDVKYRDRISFKNTALLIYSTNLLHGFAENIAENDSVWRRLHPLVFQHSIPYEQQDPMLMDKLRLEYPAIVRKYLIPALQRLYNNDWVFPHSNYIEDTRKKVLLSDDTIQLFVNATCHFDTTGKTSTLELHGRYQNYCSSIGKIALNRHDFVNKLLNKFPELRKERSRTDSSPTNPISVIVGIKTQQN